MNRRSPYKDHFLHARDRAYLNTGAEGLIPKVGLEAMQQYGLDKSLGAKGRERFYAVEEQARALVADFIGGRKDEIAFLSNASEGINRLCNALSWGAGDEVVIDDLEFPSNVLPWIKLRRCGVNVKVVQAVDRTLRVEDFERAVTDRTRLISVSLVSYKSGFRADIQRLGELAHSVRAFLMVDATQGLGCTPFSVQGVDFMVASSYKWLLAPHGLGVVYCRRDLLDRLEPRSIGWRSVEDIFAPDRFERYDLRDGAAKMELGMPNFPALYALNAGIRYLQGIGLKSIERNALDLGTVLIEAFEDMGLDVLTPIDRTKRAGIVSFEHPEVKRIAAELEQDHVFVWGGDGRIRVSTHLYNDMEDVERLLGSLQKIL